MSRPATTASCELLLTPSDVRERGLKLLEVHMTSRASSETKEKIFMQHYGSNAASLAYQWYDLCVVEDPSIRLDIKEISVDGFRKFMMAHNFLWTLLRTPRFFPLAGSSGSASLAASIFGSGLARLRL